MNYALIGASILIVSTLGAIIILSRQETPRPKQVKWALFVFYFWLLNFIQLVLFGLVYQLKAYFIV